MQAALQPSQALLRCEPALQIYFPVVYDIKYLMKFCTNLHGGLNKLAETLEVERVGPQHQARCPLGTQPCWH